MSHEMMQFVAFLAGGVLLGGLGTWFILPRRGRKVVRLTKTLKEEASSAERFILMDPRESIITGDLHLIAQKMEEWKKEKRDFEYLVDGKVKRVYVKGKVKRG